MKDLQKLGGIAALINAAAYIVGFSMVLTILAPIIGAEPDQFLAFLVANQTLLVVWYLIIYLVAGVFMVPLVLAMHARLQANLSALLPIATAFGLIWAGLVLASRMLLVNNVAIVSYPWTLRYSVCR